MPKPKRLSGAEVVKMLAQFGFEVERQRGSHIILVRERAADSQTLLISNHKELKAGAVVAISTEA